MGVPETGMTHIFPPFCTHQRAALQRPAGRRGFRGEDAFALADAGGTTSSFTFQMQRIAEHLRHAGRGARGRGGAGMEDTRSWLAYPTVYK